MCGIYGVVHRAGDTPAPMTVARERLRHRGPDGSGEERLPHALFGHLRLSILDLTDAGAQPMWDAQRLSCITYNGEIYNFAELRAECEAAGLTFRSRSDTEVILNQYLLRGPSSFARLNGMFAFALYDSRSGETFLVRDQMGIKPLYYAEAAGKTWFASELGALLATNAIPRDIDRVAVQAYLQLDYVPAPLSIVRGVSKLPRGCALRIDAQGGHSITEYSTVHAVATSRTSRTMADDVATFGELLRTAVASQLVADVPVGIFLSGGLDSSLVAHTAAEVHGRVSTFSIAFDEPSFDERRYFDAVSRAIGSDHHVEVLDSSRMLDLLPGIAAITTEPLADGSILPTTLLSRFTRRHVKVALSGDGADELFGGYPTYAASRAGDVAARLPRLVTRMLRRTADLAPTRYSNFSPEYKARKFLDGIDRDPVTRHLRWMGTFTPAQVKTLMTGWSEEADRRIGELLRPELPAGLSTIEQLLRTDERLYLQNGVLAKVDRASMSASLEVRVPFLDDRIVRFAHALPTGRKVGITEFKRLLKRYAETRLPREVVTRKKKGFGAPLGRWFRHELRDFLGDELAPERVAAVGILDPSQVQRLLQDHWSGRADRRKELFNVLSLMLWSKEFERHHAR